MTTAMMIARIIIQTMARRVCIFLKSFPEIFFCLKKAGLPRLRRDDLLNLKPEEKVYL